MVSEKSFLGVSDKSCGAYAHRVTAFGLRASSISVIAAVLFLGMAEFSGNASAADATATASATIIPAIAIAKTSDMNFGSVVPGSSAGTVVLASNGTATSALTLTGSKSAAAFSVTGGVNTAYTITLPTTTTLSDGAANSMTVNGFTSSIGTAGTLSAGGTQSFNVGATLNVGASQASGDYTGSFTVTVAYN